MGRVAASVETRRENRTTHYAGITVNTIILFPNYRANCRSSGALDYLDTRVLISPRDRGEITGNCA